MKKLFILAHVGCWIVVAAFVSASVAYGIYVRHVFAEASRPGSLGLMCGNVIIDPLVFVLSYLAPVAGCGVIGLGFLWERGRIEWWRPASAAIVFGVALVFLVAYGVWLFQTMLPGVAFSDIVWWLRPVWRAF